MCRGETRLLDLFSESHPTQDRLIPGFASQNVESRFCLYIGDEEGPRRIRSFQAREGFFFFTEEGVVLRREVTRIWVLGRRRSNF